MNVTRRVAVVLSGILLVAILAWQFHQSSETEQATGNLRTGSGSALAPEAEPAIETPAEDRKPADEPQVSDVEGPAVSGFVIDRAGDPISEATVYLGVSGARAEIKTGANGEFRYDGLEEIQYSLRVTHPAYSTLRRFVMAGETGLKVVLDELGAVEGRVVSARDGAPIQEFRIVTARGADVEWFRSASGAFRVEGLKLGAVRLKVNAKGFEGVS